MRAGTKQGRSKQAGTKQGQTRRATKTGSGKAARSRQGNWRNLTTLAIDIGGSGLKMMALDSQGHSVSERLRVPTPHPASPGKMLAILDEMKAQMPAFDRVSVGFPGVIKQGETLTAANLDKSWVGFPLEQTLEQKWGKPVRVCNDAAVQGYGAIRGRGVELVLTLGTGVGSALYTDGRLCPGLELAHHPWRKGKTYEELIGRAALDKIGHKKWNRLVERAIAQTEALFNWDHLYIGGGNSRKLEIEPRPEVTLIENEQGLTGGIALWQIAN
ncbi:MAG TPA: ROK family protein [Acidisarcina sp.]|nr:ROK family protein [Acidisarcina sp.]